MLKEFYIMFMFLSGIIVIVPGHLVVMLMVANLIVAMRDKIMRHHHSEGYV